MGLLETGAGIVENIFQMNLESIPDLQVRFGLGALAVAGLLYCYFGYPLFRLLLALAGFALAGAVAALLAGWLSGGNLTAMAAALAFGGVCGAMALYWLYRVGVFCLGVLGGLVIAQAALGDRLENWVPYALIGAAVGGGLAALLLERTAMTFATAAVGAWVTVYMAAFIVAGFGLEPYLDDAVWRARVPWILAGCWMLLAVTGALAQFRMRRRQ